MTGTGSAQEQSKDIHILFLPDLSEEPVLREDVWKIVCECDREFVPPLSARTTTDQKNLNLARSGEAKPLSYFETLARQRFLIAQIRESGETAGFMSYRYSYVFDNLPEYSPCNYLTTLCVKQELRRRGIAGMLYHHVLHHLPDQERCGNVVTRTWSTNDKHSPLLKQLGFKLVRRLGDHRGEGIDTVYWAKRINPTDCDG